MNANQTHAEYVATFNAGECNIFGEPTNAGRPTYADLVRMLDQAATTLDILNLAHGMDNAVGEQITAIRAALKSIG